MKIQPATLPIIHEGQAKWEPSSQETRLQKMTNSDAPCVLHAARIERQAKSTPYAPALRPQQPQQNQQNRQQSPRVKAFKNIFHRAALTCCALILPSFAFAGLGAIGLLAPAVLLVVGILLFALAGRPTDEMEAEQAEIRERVRNFDCRGSV